MGKLTKDTGKKGESEELSGRHTEAIGHAR